jgi:hypothetical protein
MINENITINLAQQITFSGIKETVIVKNSQMLLEKMSGKMIKKGDILKFKVNDNIIELVVVNHTPEPGIVMIHEKTHLFIQDPILQRGGKN